MPRESGTPGGDRTPPPRRRAPHRPDGGESRATRRHRRSDEIPARRHRANPESGAHRPPDERVRRARNARIAAPGPDEGEGAPRTTGTGVGARGVVGRWPATRVALAVLSVLVLLVTGFAWRSVDSLRSNIATAGGLGLGGAADGAVDILMVGTDSRTDAHGNALSPEELASLNAGEEVASNTDTIVLIRVPNDGSSATAISIPRDSYVEVPGIGMSKINAAYGATKENKRLELVEQGKSDAEAEPEATEAGREALVESVANLTGITVDHYAEVGLLGFVLLTDAVGGVDVCLANPVDEPLSGADFPAGEQKLTGSQALSFVRQRHDLPRGDLDRIVRQQVFMASLVRNVLSARTLSNPGKLGQMSTAVQRSVTLDSDWDILQFATRLQDLAGGKVKFETIPAVDINATTDYGESIVQVDPGAVKKYVAGLLGAGNSAEDNADNAEADSADAPSIEPSTVTIDVANDSGIDGLANGVAGSLTALGYVGGTIGNYEGTSISTSRVEADDVDSDAARAVAQALGGLQITADTGMPADTVRVVLASDYAGPGSGQAATAETIAPESGTAVPEEPAAPIDAGSTGPMCVN